MTTPIFHNFNRYSSINAKPHIPKLLLFIFTMSSSFFFLYFFLFFSLSSSASTHHSRAKSGRNDPPIAAIRQACKSTRFPAVCESMLSQPGRVPANPDPVGLIQSAMRVSAQNLKVGQSMVQKILDDSDRNPNRSRAAQTCLEVLGNSDVRTSAAEVALSRGKLRDARAWASAALSYQYDCWSGLKYVNDSAEVNSTMPYFDTVLIASTSNALSMLRALDALGPNPATWAPPRTERDGFWEPVVGGTGSGPLKFRSLSSTFKEADATVCKGGAAGCNYGKVQEAVDAAPENLEAGKQYVIKIKEGVYDEIVRVPYNKRNLVFLGDGMGKTVITGSLNAGMQGITTYNTVTVACG